MVFDFPFSQNISDLIGFPFLLTFYAELPILLEFVAQLKPTLALKDIDLQNVFSQLSNRSFFHLLIFSINSINKIKNGWISYYLISPIHQNYFSNEEGFFLPVLDYELPEIQIETLVQRLQKKKLELYMSKFPLILAQNLK